MKEGLRAVGYGRVSTEEQEKSGTSLRDQFAGNHKKAKETGAAMVAYFEDSDSGNFYLTRKGLQDALKTLEEGKANVLIVKDLIRLTRNDRAEQALILKRIKDAGATIVFWDVTYENSPMGDFALNVTGDFAILEKAVIKDRTDRGRRRRAMEGIMTCTRPPFGYNIPTKADIIRGTYQESERGKYILNPVTAPIAAELFERRASGESLNSLASWLHNSRVATTQGGKYWLPCNVREIFNNPAYYGLAAFGRFKYTRDETRLLRGRKRPETKVAVPEDQWIRIPCPAIVTKETWDKCQAVSRENREKLSTCVRYRCLLTGLLRCPKCRKVMIGRHRYGRRQLSHYMCKEYYAGSNAAGHVCSNKHYPTAGVEALTLEAVKRVIHYPEIVEAAYEAYHTALYSDFSEQEYQALKRELADLAKEEMATAQAQIRGIAAGADTVVYENVLRELALRRTVLQSCLEDLEVARSQVRSAPDRTTLVQEAMADVEVVLDAPEDVVPTSEKNALLLKIIEHIVPEGDGFAITFKPLDDTSRLVTDVAFGQEPVIRVV